MIPLEASILGEVESACRALDVHPQFTLGPSGVEVLDSTGQKLAALTHTYDGRAGPALSLELRCDRLARAMECRPRTLRDLWPDVAVRQ